MRIGIFGGTFDPIHIGHLWVGEAAKESLSLDELRWIPVAESPLKGRGPIASDQARLQMLHLALDATDGHIVDDREIRRGSISYTLDTVADLAAEFLGAEIVMVIGSDSLASMRQWHQPEMLLSQVVPAVIQRGGETELDFSVLDGLVEPDRINLFRQHVIRMPVIELSSSELRERIAHGRSIRFRTPRSVEALIAAEKLYASKE
jgi:nicotinate-nucleotide adenylyltransferase